MTKANVPEAGNKSARGTGRRRKRRARVAAAAPQPGGDLAPKAASVPAGLSRGMVLDIVVFVLNLILMNLLAGRFMALVWSAGEDDTAARVALGLCFLGALVLPAAGAILKRWHFHSRRRGGGEEGPDGRRRRFDPVSILDSGAAGCLFNPIFYFCLSLVISSAVMALLGELVFGKDLKNDGAVFVPLVLATVVFSSVQTFLVYRYFSPPKRDPEGEFWRGPRSELLGDACIFTHMVLFQIFWYVLVGQISFGRVTGFGDLAGRIFFLSFVALLVYFPPRIFYLAEDIGRRAAWLTILLANSPTILRVLFGDAEIGSGLLQ